MAWARPRVWAAATASGAPGSGEYRARGGPGVRSLRAPTALEAIRAQLLRQEDALLWAWVRRAQYRGNAAVYEPGGVPASGLRGASLLMFLLEETEVLHAKVRRFTSPDEHAFFPASLGPPLVEAVRDHPSPLPDGLGADHPRLNLNADVLAAHLGDVLPRLAPPGDDGNWGSTALADVACLQALSKRVHFGKLVAEAKFQAAPEKLAALAEAGDEAALLEALTVPAQEARVLCRVARKAAVYGRALGGLEAEEEPAVEVDGEASASSLATPLTPELASDLWSVVIALTKKAEVAYLLERCSTERAPAELPPRSGAVGNWL